MTKSKLDKDFRDFLTKEEANPSKQVSNIISNMVKKDLDPKIQIIYMKLFFIQIITGALTLIFCPQFSISLTGNDAIFHIFHSSFGMYGCMAICGSIFVGSGSMTSAFFLKKPETKKIHKYNFITFSLVSFLSLLTFSFFGEVVSVEIILSWLIGAVIGGVVMFEISRLLKVGLMSRFTSLEN